MTGFRNVMTHQLISYSRTARVNSSTNNPFIHSVLSIISGKQTSKIYLVCRLLLLMALN